MVLKRYASKRLWLDILSVVPVDYFFFASPATRAGIRLTRLVKAYRVPWYFAAWGQYTVHPNIFRLIRLVLGLIACMHILSCVVVLMRHLSALGYADMA